MVTVFSVAVPVIHSVVVLTHHLSFPTIFRSFAGIITRHSASTVAAAAALRLGLGQCPGASELVLRPGGEPVTNNQ